MTARSKSTGPSRPAPRSPKPRPINHDPATVAPGHASAQGRPGSDRDKMGQNGTETQIFRPSGPDSCQSQVQNPALAPLQRDEMGQNGTELGNSCPTGPARSDTPAREPLDGYDGSETTYPELVRGLLDFLGSGDGEPESASKKIVPLTARQLSALPYLAAFPSINQAAHAAAIGRSTLYRWLEDDRFREKLIRLREETAEFARQEAKGLMLRAVDVFRDAMSNGDITVRLRAARYSLDYSSQVGLAENLRQEVERLEIAVDEWKTRVPLR